MSEPADLRLLPLGDRTLLPGSPRRWQMPGSAVDPGGIEPRAAPAVSDTGGVVTAAGLSLADRCEGLSRMASEALDAPPTCTLNQRCGKALHSARDVVACTRLLQDSALAFSGLGPGLPRSARLRPPLRLRLGLPVGGCGCGGMSIDRRRGLLGLPSCHVRWSAAGLAGLKAVMGAPSVATDRGGEAIGVVGMLTAPSVPPSLRRLQEWIASLKQEISCICGTW